MKREEGQPRELPTARPLGLAGDARLVERIYSGSDAAWREFLERYSGLVYGVLRRHLISEDEDEIRNIYVDILKALHDGELFKYQNRSSLATWLAVLARAKAFDYRRKVRGRRRVPRGVERLGRLEKQVLQLYFVERLSLDIVLHTLHWKGFHVGTEDVVDAIERIEERLDSRFLRRLDDEAVARVNGAASIRVLRFLGDLRAHQQRDTMRYAPDQALVERDADERSDRVREMVDGLGPEEKKIITLRFEQDLSAREIAESLGLDGPRKVYTILSRVLARFRLKMRREEVP